MMAGLQINARPTGLLVWLVIAVAAYALSFLPDRSLSLSLVLGTVLGIVFQRGRFCFYCNLTDYIDHRNASGVLSILTALATGIVFYAVVISAWLHIPAPDALPPGAHIGPVGSVLVVGAFSFGCGTALSGSCLSAHFYRLGEGAFGSLFALAGAAVGFTFGFMSWNTLFLAQGFDDPALWLPHYLGYAGTLVLQLLALGVLAAVILRSARDTADRKSAEAISVREKAGLSNVFLGRWPPVVTGLLVACVSGIAYLRVGPLGVTAELGSLVRMAATPVGLIPHDLLGLDTLRGCISSLRDGVLSKNGLFVFGLVAGSLGSAVLARQFHPSLPPPRTLFLRFAGGILMGWGAMTALGCTVGVLLSGIHAGAVSGWVFLVSATVGVMAARPVAQFFSRNSGRAKG